MRVACPIATVSYNSEKWLRKVLERLIKAGIIEYAYYIWHQGEDGDKDHFHVWLMPTKVLQTADLKALFNEPDPKNPSNPLGVLPFRKSEVKNWIQYAIHNPVYLMQHKNDLDEVTKIPYDPADIKVMGVQRVQFERDLRSSYSVLETANISVSKMLLEGESAVDTAIMANADPRYVLAMMALIQKDRDIGANPVVLKEIVDLSSKVLTDKNNVSRETLPDKKGS